MILSVQSLIGKPVEHEKEQIGSIETICFSAETGKLTGITTQQKEFFPFSEILFEERYIRIHKQNTEEAEGESWMRYKVASTHGEELGEVTDVEFDGDLGVMRRILVTKSVFSLPLSQKIFPYERIVHIRKKKILVDDDATEKEEQAEFCPV